MSLTLRVPRIDASAGALSDGVVRGRINQSTLTSVSSEVATAAATYALHVDDGAARTITDVSVAAGDDAAGDFRPWGTTAQFSAGDECWIACDSDVEEVYVRISTSGAWTGTGLSVLESLDGSTLTAVPSLVDGSNGLRAAAGVHRISFGSGGTRQLISPTFGGTKRRYVVLRPNGLTGVTTAPVLDRIWIVHPPADRIHTDLTASHGAALTDGVFSAAQQAATNFYTPESAIYFASPGLAIGQDVTVWRRVASTRTAIREYLASDGSWKPFTGVSDPGDTVRVGPTAYDGLTSQAFAVRWDVPSDWTAMPLTLAPAAAITAHWFRLRVTAVPAPGPTPAPLLRGRARAFGQGLASGIYHRDETTYRYLTYAVAVPPTTAEIVNFVVGETGAARSVTLPANVYESGAIAGGRLDFASPLVVPADGELIVAHVSGGSVQDAELRLA